MKSRAIDNKRKELDNQGNLISDELQDIFKEIHNNKLYPPYDINLPIIQKMRNLESQLDAIDKEVDRLEEETWTTYRSEKDEVARILQEMSDSAIEVCEDGLIKHYTPSPREFSKAIFKDYFMVSFSDYHKLMVNKYHYHVTFSDLGGAYAYHKPFYTNEPLNKLFEYCKDIMGFSYITDCTVKDLSDIKQYEIQNCLSLDGNTTYSYSFSKYIENGNEIVYGNKSNSIHTAHFDDGKIFIGQCYNQSPLVTIGNYQYTYTNDCIQQHKFILVGSQLFKSDSTNIDKLKKNLDRLLNKKYFGRFDELNQMLKDYYHI